MTGDFSLIRLVQLDESFFCLMRQVLRQAIALWDRWSLLPYCLLLALSSGRLYE